MQSLETNKQGETGASSGSKSLGTVDTSTSGGGDILALDRAERRRKQFRDSQAKRRLRLSASGAGQVIVTLDAEEMALFEAARWGHNGNPETFAKRALLTGAKFLFNSGNECGGKRRIKGAK